MNHPDEATPKFRVVPLEHFMLISRIEALHQQGIHRVYLAGPMSGIQQHNWPAFHAAAADLRAAGLNVVNPAELGYEKDDRGNFPNEPDEVALTRTWEQCLTRDLEQLLVHTQATVVLPGWRNSKGASLEVDITERLGRPVLELETLEPISETILEEAQRYVYGPRQKDYGHPIDNFNTLGYLIAPLVHRMLSRQGLEVPVSLCAFAPEEVALLMCQVKIARLTHDFSKRDTVADLAGYAATLQMVVEERQRRESELPVSFSVD